MPKFAFAAVLLFLGPIAIGCGGGKYEYQPPPPNSGVDEQVERDAGVVTDESLMSSGGNQE